jgi:hypothetical protein
MAIGSWQFKLEVGKRQLAYRLPNPITDCLYRELKSLKVV